MERAIISAAITGGVTVPGQRAAVPVTPEETVEPAPGAYGARSTIALLQVGEPGSGKPGADTGLLREAVYGIGGRCDAIVQPTTGGGEGVTLGERAGTNAARVEKVVALAAAFDREPAASDEAGEVLGLKVRSAVAL